MLTKNLTILRFQRLCTADLNTLSLDTPSAASCVPLPRWQEGRSQTRGCNHLALDLLSIIWYPRTLKRKPTCALWIGLHLQLFPAHVFQQVKALKALRFCRRTLVPRLMGDCRTPLSIAKKARPRPSAATILPWMPAALRFYYRALVPRLMGDCRSPLPICKKARPRPSAATILPWMPAAASGIPELWIGLNLSYSAGIAESLRCHTQMYSNQQIDTAPLEQ